MDLYFYTYMHRRGIVNRVSTFIKKKIREIGQKAGSRLFTSEEAGKKSFGHIDVLKKNKKKYKCLSMHKNL